MINNLKLNKILWLVVACLALIVAFIGVINQDIYSKVVTDEWLPTIVAQDGATIAAGLILLFLALKTAKAIKRNSLLP
ncbi:MAG: hypothetical protein HN929_12025 [Chloroflexi bacterium]|nr:hypothetical protein [Chloroflexota bacterium]MBT7082167.1 hypothetical protein [Chloroflexota bacterium]